MPVARPPSVLGVRTFPVVLHATSSVHPFVHCHCRFECGALLRHQELPCSIGNLREGKGEGSEALDEAQTIFVWR